MRFLGRTLKYLLRSIFSIIVFLLLVGWAKMNRDTNAYISFLNNNDRSVFHWSQPSTWTNPFWSHQTSGDIADIFPDTTVDTGLSGLDVYDPALKQDLNTITDSSFSGSTGGDFWFTTDGQNTSGTDTSSGSNTISQLLQQRELAK